MQKRSELEAEAQARKSQKQRKKESIRSRLEQIKDAEDLSIRSSVTYRAASQLTLDKSARF